MTLSDASNGLLGIVIVLVIGVVIYMRVSGKSVKDMIGLVKEWSK